MKTCTNENDFTLLIQFIESEDQQSFTELVHRHGSLVMGVCYRILQNQHDAQEAAQATFIQLALKAKKISSGQPLAAWLYTVARHKALDSYKSRARRAKRLQVERRDAMLKEAVIQPPQTFASDQEALSASIDAAISNLPAIYRTVVILHYLNGQTLNEIADSLECNPSTVSMRLTRAKDKLRQNLSKRGVTASSLTAATIGSLQAATPAMEAGFAVNTYQAAANALAVSKTVGLTKIFSSGKALLATVTSIAIIGTGVALYSDNGSESGVKPPTVAPIMAEAPAATPEPEVVAEAANPFDFVSTRAGIEDVKHAQLFNYIQENLGNLDEPHNNRGETLLQAAVRRGNCVGSFLLLYFGADPNVSDAMQETPLTRAMRLNGSDSYLIRDMLIYKGADVNAHNNAGDTPLIIAVEAKNFDNVEFLLWRGAELHPRSASAARLPSALARSMGHSRILEMLQVLEYPETAAYAADLEIEKVPDATVPDFVKRSLIEAANKADLARLEALITEGADINTRDNSGRTILHTATQKEHSEVVTYLIFMGADVNALDKRGMPPILVCSNVMGFGWDWIRYMLLLAGTDMDIEIKNGHNSLTLSAAHGNGHPLQLAIWMGVDPSAETSQGTAMHIASKAGRQRIVEQLQRNGVTEPPFITDDPGWLMHAAAKKSDLDTMRRLIDSGVSPDLTDEQGMNPMINAIHSRRMDAAQFLLAAESDPNFQRPDLTTPLHATVAWNYWEVHRFREELLRAGADPNLADENGRTPLIQASQGNGRLVQAVPQLLLFGADINHRDKHGKRAIDYARKAASDEITTYLIEMGAEL